jgi:hypothetical protein
MNCILNNAHGKGMLALEGMYPNLDPGFTDFFASGNALGSTAFNSGDGWSSGAWDLGVGGPGFVGVKKYSSPRLVPSLPGFGWYLARDVGRPPWSPGSTFRVLEGLVNAGKTFTLASGGTSIVPGRSAFTVYPSSYLAPDSWNFYWEAGFGNPGVVDNWLGARTQLKYVALVGSGMFASTAAVHEDVLSWAFTTTSKAERQELIVVPVVPVDSWELRARVWLPGEDATGSPMILGACGKFTSPSTGPEFFAGASSWGACFQSGTSEYVKNETGDIRSTWVTLTIRATRTGRAGTTATRGQIGFSMWCGETFAGSWNAANVGESSLVPGMIRVGRPMGSAAKTLRIASLAWRAGNNSALPSETFRGQGFF